MQLHAAALNAIQCQIHMCSAISLVVQGRDSGRFKIFLMKILDVLLTNPMRIVSLLMLRWSLYLCLSLKVFDY